MKNGMGYKPQFARNHCITPYTWAMVPRTGLLIRPGILEIARYQPSNIFPVFARKPYESKPIRR